MSSTRSVAMRPLARLAPVVAALALSAALAACDGGTDAPPRLSGTYTGTTTAPTFRETFTFTLSSSGQVVTGTSRSVRTQLATGRDTTFTGETISGQHFHPNVTLSISSPTYSDYGFAGTVSSDGRTLSGRLFGSGYANETLVLTRP